MSDHNDHSSSATPRRDLLELLLSEIDEEQQDGFEERALSNDDFFEALASEEDELVDAYIQGELPEDKERLVAKLLAASSRLQESAELGAALFARGRLERLRVESASSSPNTPQAPASNSERLRTRSPMLLLLVFLVSALTVLAIYQTVRTRAQQKTLEKIHHELARSSEELEKVEQKTKDLERQLAREQAANRLLRRTEQSPNP